MSVGACNTAPPALNIVQLHNITFTLYYSIFGSSLMLTKVF